MGVYMKNDGLYISYDIMEKYTSGIDKSCNNLDKSYNDTNTNFKGLINNDIYRNGFSNISKALIETMDTLKQSNRVNRYYMSSFASLEDKGSSLIETIEVPNISVVDSKLTLLKKDYMNLYKEDGSSVKTEDTKESYYEDIYDEENKDLKELNTLYEEKEKNIDVLPDKSKTNLEDINSKDSQLVDYEDKNYDIDVTNISNMIKERQKQFIEFDDRHSFNSKELTNINNANNYDINYEDKYILDSVNLQKIDSLIDFEPLIEDKD